MCDITISKKEWQRTYEKAKRADKAEAKLAKVREWCEDTIKYSYSPREKITAEEILAIIDNKEGEDEQS